VDIYTKMWFIVLGMDKLLITGKRYSPISNLWLTLKIKNVIV